MTTKRDPWVNMLRTTVACFAAGVGGADVVTVQPFDAALGLPDSFSRRIARNTQSLLVEEGHLARVLDPAGGSWYVESLTDAARAGGLGLVHRDRAGRRPGRGAGLRPGPRPASPPPGTPAPQRLATRKDAITGVSEFPNLAEKLPDAAARRPTVLPSGGLPRVRAAQEFEELRDARRRRRRAADGLPRHDRPDRPAHRPGLASPATCSRRAGSQTPSGDGVDGLRRGGDDGRLHLRHRQGLRASPPPRWRRS